MLAAAEDYGRRNKWLKIAGGAKATALRALVRAVRPVVALELGTYCVAFSALTLYDEMVRAAADDAIAAAAAGGGGGGDRRGGGGEAGSGGDGGAGGAASSLPSPVVLGLEVDPVNAAVAGATIEVGVEPT